MTEYSCDILVIGGGMAGTAIAAHLSEYVRVVLVEMEEQPGYHSTGRSAALFSETYGNEVIRALSRASRPLFFAPPGDFSAIPLVRPRPVLFFGHHGQEAAFEAHVRHEAGNRDVQRLSPEAAIALCPVLRPEGLIGGILDSGTADIEVHELQQGYLRLLRSRGSQVVTSTRITQITKEPGGWAAASETSTFRAAIIVNAAGAWADQIGALAGAQTIGLAPLRRTAALVELPNGLHAEDWPMILDVEEGFYAKPDAGLLLLSPADETPSDPCDAYPDELDIAIAIDRLQTATTLDIRRVKSRWAGLRSFVKDRSPVVGYDGLREGFFWLAALGGYGIQTAPALSRVAAGLVFRRPLDPEIARFGVDTAAISPQRLQD